MEFTGNIQFADESSWLTLTTESDDTVTISVRLNTFVPNQEVMSFEVTPNSGIVRLPAGEILRVLKGNGVGMITGVFAATQGTSSCSYSFSVLPCRKFAYKSLAATIFTTRPEKSPVHVGAEDRLWFYRMAGDVSTYVRFNYLAGGSSSNYELSPTYSINLKYYDLDISADTMLATASAKGLDVSNIVSYDVWIECSGSKSTVYSFVIKRMRLPLKTYKFLGRRGTYEYIHATGKFSRSIESETQVFVNSGIEQELENDYSMTFEQNSGHIDSVGMNGYWLEFLAAKERYIIEKDGSERAIVVDEFKTSLTDRTVSSMTFKWHYANPNNTVIDKVDIDITGLGILGPSTVNDVSNTAQFQVTYSPSNTTQRSITWSVVSGSDYASIDGNGMLTVKSNAKRSEVKVRATSTDKPNIYAEKSVNVTYFSAEVSISFQKDSIGVEAKAGTVTNTFTTTGLTNLRVSASGGMTITTGPSITGYLIGFAYAENTGNSAKMATVTLTGDRTDGKGTYSKSFTIVQSAARAATWSLPATQAFEAGGDGAIFTITDKDSAGWRLTLPDWCLVSDGITEGSGDRDTDLVARANDTGSSRTGTVQLVSTDGNTVYATCTVTQESKILLSWDVPATFRFDSNGQSDLSASGLDLNITDPDNVGWTIEGPSYVGNSLVSDNPLPISGTGNKSLSLAPDVNTSSERTFDLVLKASTGDVIATCNCTQDASESENTVAMKIAISNADQVLDVADHNPEVCINTNGLTITDGLSLGTIVSMDSQYIYIDIPKSNVAELYNKLMVDWKYNQFLYVHILNGSTNPDTVYNNETSKHTDFYNNENFLLCEIAKVQADLFTKVENVVTSHGSIILESDCIIEEYQTRYHAVIKTDESWVSKVSSQFSSEKFGLVWLMNRDNNTIYLPIFPYVTGVDAGGSVPKLRMDVYRCIPMPLSVFKLNNLAFVTDFAATESTQVGIVSISEIKTGNLSLSNLPTFVLSETYFGTEVPGFDSSVVLEMQNPSVLDLSNHVSTAFKGDIIITLNCDDLFLDIS